MTSKSKRVPAPYLLSLPSLTLLALLFVLPVFGLIATSFVAAEGGSLTLDVYRRVFADGYNLTLVWRTFKLCIVTTFVTLILAFPVALYLRQSGPRVRLVVSFILLAPLLTSVVVRTLAWVVLLSPSGVVNQALAAMGLDPIRLIYNDTGVIIGLTHVYFGYMVLALMASMLKIDENLLLAASNLGATSWQILRAIIVPLSLPGAVAGSILVFTMCASTYATPRLLGASASKVLATEIYDLAIVHVEWREAAALASILLLLAGTAVWIGTRVAESGRRRAVFA